MIWYLVYLVAIVASSKEEWYLVHPVAMVASNNEEAEKAYWDRVLALA